MLVNLLSVAGVMKTIGGVLLAVVILLAMVTIHEFGHYIAGRLLGFKITEFSVGFGPALLKKRSKKTGVLFALRLVPLGGYCAFDGEDEDLSKKEEKGDKTNEPFEEMTADDGENLKNEGGMSATNENPSVTQSENAEDDPQEENKKEDEYPEPQGARFNDQPPWKRIIVLIAGATMNYLLALFLIILMFACVGRPVYTVTESDRFQSAAGQTFEGLQAGDTILEINGKTLYMLTDWQDALNGKKKGDVVDVLVIRDGKKQTVPVSLYQDASVKNMSDSNVIFYSLGLVVYEEVNGEMQLVRYLELHSQTVRDGFFQTIGHSFMYSFKLGGSVLRSLGELITGKLGIQAMGGPVTTISVTAEAAVSGFASFLNIAALIGVNLAVFNLLPVPALDGCKVIFCIIEWIRKKPINRKVETIINLVGIIFLLGFAVLIDLLHFIL
ncbi:MAG: site-2 protease family protein [Clostridia bacterium]|nr:site-2 protease family protein [Clostridia bacterium]